MNISENFLQSARKEFMYYKSLGEKAIAQIPDEKLFWQYNEESNSIDTIVKHLWGNMLSRWTNFMTTDGEKEWRKRDAEFENDVKDRAELLKKWHDGWTCVFNALNSLQPDDLVKIIYIRNQGHTIMEAINRQLAHYPHHVGQILFVAKMIVGSNWLSLSIPKNKSQEFNTEKFSQEKTRSHFTDNQGSRK